MCSIKGHLRAETKLLTQDRTSEMIKFSKKQYTNIFNISPAISVFNFAVPLKLGTCDVISSMKTKELHQLKTLITLSRINIFRCIFFTSSKNDKYILNS